MVYWQMNTLFKRFQGSVRWSDSYFTQRLTELWNLLKRIGDKLKSGILYTFLSILRHHLRKSPTILWSKESGQTFCTDRYFPYPLQDKVMHRCIRSTPLYKTSNKQLYRSVLSNSIKQICMYIIIDLSVEM